MQAEGLSATERPKWSLTIMSSPLIIAILAAAVAGVFSTVVAMVNGTQQRGLEHDRAEADRILEMIKTGDPDRAAQNLKFLLDSGLISGGTTSAKLTAYLKTRQPGTGPSLPVPNANYAFDPGGGIKPEQATAMAATLDKYINRLAAIGFKTGQGQVQISVVPHKEGSEVYWNAYYAGASGIKIDEMLSDDPDVVLREYTHHILMENTDDMGQELLAVESGIADYLVASFQGRPDIGLTAIKRFHESGLLKERTVLRSVRSDMSYAEFTKILDEDPSFGGATFWGSILWDIRTAIGAEPTDQLLGRTWPGFDQSAPKVSERLAAQLFKNGESGLNSQQSVRVSFVLAARGLIGK